MSASNIVDIAAERKCVCGHARREHEFCSDEYPTVCVHQVPEEGALDWPVCHCLEFETENSA